MAEDSIWHAETTSFRLISYCFLLCCWMFAVAHQVSCDELFVGFWGFFKTFTTILFPLKLFLMPCLQIQARFSLLLLLLIAVFGFWKGSRYTLQYFIIRTWKACSLQTQEDGLSHSKYRKHQNQGQYSYSLKQQK